MTDLDKHDLSRFLKAQEGNFSVALMELLRGQKQSHWMWYIFPQVSGLGHSPMAHKYAIRSRQEAVAYLQHEVLGHRLRRCTAALITHKDRNIEAIMGYPDYLKLRSSMTLFGAVSEPSSVFAQVLDQFYSGETDSKTLEFLEGNP